MVTCKKCGSANCRNNGGSYLTTMGIKKQRVKCRDCNFAFSVEENLDEEEIVLSSESNKILVITSAKNDTPINEAFLDTLETYCEHRNAELIIIPVSHKPSDEPQTYDFPPEIRKYLCEKNRYYPKENLKIFCSLKISSAIENPLAGLDPLSKGINTIIGHPQVQLKTLPRIHEDYPSIMTTTGCISVRNYRNNKTGTKADFNHSFSAVVVEFDDGFVHIRHLNFDDSSSDFYDLDNHYVAWNKTVQKSNIEAIITGDEHQAFIDKTVKNATYDGPKSIVGRLKPTVIVRHDVLDAYSISHHHNKNTFLKYEKYITGKNILEKELNGLVDFLDETTPSNATTHIVQSNHNEHLLRWLNEADPKVEPWNARIFHWLSYKVLGEIEAGNKNIDPLKMYYESVSNKPNIKFVGRNEKFEIFGISLGSHGDVGNNGARGSRKQFSILPTKCVIGHSHSPGIEKGCYQVGTSSKFGLEYNNGASSWHHAHCLIHKNGKRQLIFINYGKYCLDSQ